MQMIMMMLINEYDDLFLILLFGICFSSLCARVACEKEE